MYSDSKILIQICIPEVTISKLIIFYGDLGSETDDIEACLGLDQLW